jgi:citrate lyase beta subunit
MARLVGPTSMIAWCADLLMLLCCANARSQGKDLGFDGKTLLHPSTVEIANRVFGPSELEVEDARALLQKLEGMALDGELCCFLAVCALVPVSRCWGGRRLA